MITLFSRLTLALGALALLTSPLRAQVLDPTFTTLDSRAASPNSKGNVVRVLATDPAGRLLVGGSFDFLNGQVQGKVGRLLPNGQSDPTFGAGGVGANGTVAAILPLPNGQYVIGGTFTRYDGQPAGRLARLNTDGSFDPTFNAGGLGADLQVLTLARDGQGRVLVGGNFHRFNGQPAAGVVRLSAAGVPDPTFAFSTPAYENVVYSIVSDPAGNVLVGGYMYFETPGVYPFDGLLQRLLPSGAPDPTFTDSLTPEDLVFRIALLPTGKLLIGGYLFTDSTYQYSRGIQRLNADGTPDPTFAGLTSYAAVRDLVVLPNQQILLGGSNLNSGAPGNWRAVRVLPDGTPDPTFSLTSISSTVYAVAAGPAGSILVGGGFQQVDGQPLVGLARLTSSGARDAAFTPLTFQNYATISTLCRQSGDRLIASGNFSSIGGTPRPRVVRFMANGVLDPSFQLDPAVAAGMVNTPFVSVGAGDRVFTSAEEHVYRLLPDGTRDAAFNDGAGGAATNSYAEVKGMREQSDGRVLVWGSFTRYNGSPCASVVRLTTTGGVDPTFAAPLDTTLYAPTVSVSLLPDGSMAVVENNRTVYWLDAAGLPLASFNGGQGLGYISSVFALPDTTLLVNGDFVLNGTAYRGIYKLTAAGTIDPSFTLAPSLTGSVADVQPNGTLLFRQSVYGGGPQLLRLLPTGAVDPSFVPVQLGTGYAGDSNQAWVFQSTGDLVVGGGFTTVDGAQRPSLARLTNIPTGLRTDALAQSRTFDVFPNPAHTTLTLRRATTEPATATLVDVLGRPVRCWTLTVAETRLPLTGVTPGTYVVRVVGTAGVVTRRVVVE